MTSSVPIWAGGALGGIIVLMAVAIPTVVRSGAWLEGTKIVVRGTATSRGFDLASSAVQLTADQKTGLPVLTAQDAATGRRASMLLREPKEKVLVSPQKLQALADAIMAGGAADAARNQAAGQLVWLASHWPGTRSPQLR